MNFDVFFNYIMACIRLEPNVWIKSSEQYSKILQILSNTPEANGGLGSYQQDIGSEKIMKQNQNAIEAYKKYIAE